MVNKMNKNNNFNKITIIILKNPNKINILIKNQIMIFQRILQIQSINLIIINNKMSQLVIWMHLKKI